MGIPCVGVIKGKAHKQGKACPLVVSGLEAASKCESTRVYLPCLCL